ncbi:myocilin isoform X4 [Tiliqua scincoides]|uniref:myocilin isoform X4 n=1 Tax=Tiliqua scincoides TaxID=71010 RepID=UPI003462B513
MPPKFKRHLNDDDVTGSVKSERRNLLEEDSDEEEDFFLRGPSGPRFGPKNDKIRHVQNQVDEVIDVMQENITKVIERGERLDDLQDKSESLSDNATAFSNRSKQLRRQMWWRGCKMKAIVALVAVAVLLVIIVPSANEASCADPGEAMTAIQALRQESSAQQLELESAKARLGLLENLVNQLHGSQTGRGGSLSVVGLLQKEVESLKREQAQRDAQVSRLESTISNLLLDKSLLEEDKKQLQEEKEKLERQLETSIQDIAQLRANQCPQAGEAPNVDSFQGSKEVSKWDTGRLDYQELKSELVEVAASHLFQESPSPSHSVAEAAESAGCGTLVWIGEPVTFRRAENIAGKYGVWMRDPEPVSPYTHETTWRVDTVGTDVRQVFECASPEY